MNQKGYDSIQVKESYIFVSPLVRMLYGLFVFSMGWIFFYLLYAFLAIYYGISLLAMIATPLSIFTALLLSLPVFLLERILKRLCRTRKYPTFRSIQRFFIMSISATVAYLGGFFMANWLYPPLPLWISLLAPASMTILGASIPLLDFYNSIGDAVLSLQIFTLEFKIKPDDARFNKLLLSAKRIREIAEYYNMEIFPHSLALGMSVSYIKNNEATQRKFGDMIEWVEHPTDRENFRKFCKAVKKFNSVALKLSKNGIVEKHHWSFESKIALLSAVIIPFAVALIAIILPKLLEKI